MKLPISFGWVCGRPVRVDLLPRLSGECALHVHASEGWDKGHLKLEYGDTGYCLSLFIFDLRGFLEGRRVRVRCYDLWDKRIMFAAKLPDGRLHPRSGGWVYRDDAYIVDWGTYTLENAVLTVNFEKSGKKLKYRIVFKGVVRYFSPKYGYSVRTEYVFEPA